MRDTQTDSQRLRETEKEREKKERETREKQWKNKDIYRE